MLRRLSVFSGGATPDSAEHVCVLDGDVADRANVVDVIASLVDKSLVTAAGDGHVRYGLLETVRAYAADRLAESGEADIVAAAHMWPTSSTWPSGPSRSCAPGTSSSG